jgi:hypothetical protein
MVQLPGYPLSGDNAPGCGEPVAGMIMMISAVATCPAKRSLLGASAMMMVLWGGTAQKAAADEGGVSFWLPGQYGSLAALPGNPGWTFTTLYYHTEPEAGGGAEFAHGGEIRAGLAAQGDLVALGPGYIFEEPVLGGQFALSMLGIVGKQQGLGRSDADRTQWQ